MNQLCVLDECKVEELSGLDSSTASDDECDDQHDNACDGETAAVSSVQLSIHPDVIVLSDSD